MTHDQPAKGPLDGLVILDLSRILAGPTCTQLLGDLGADVIKVERPGTGDDTRTWGPPFLEPETDGTLPHQSAYYLSSNRNKRSLAVNLSSAEGQNIIRGIAQTADVLIENFKVGDLARKGLGYDALAAANPGLVYCSITGFGQTGPYADRPGYDFLIQGMGGIMSITGEPDGRPMKAGVGIADVMCGMYATAAILAALHSRSVTGKGQHIDLALFDTQLAWLINQGVGYLVSGETPARLGNGHPTIVPYDTVPASDGDFIVAVGNDAQFQRFCAVLQKPDWPRDPRFATNTERVRNRHALMAMIAEVTPTRTMDDWIAALQAVAVPCGPVNSIPAAFADPQAVHREMTIAMDNPVGDPTPLKLIGNPLKLSDTPVTYRRRPPRIGEHSRAVLAETLGLGDHEIETLIEKGVVADG